MGSGMTANGYGVPFWGDGNIPEFIVVMAAQLCEDTENHLIVYFE